MSHVLTFRELLKKPLQRISSMKKEEGGGRREEKGGRREEKGGSMRRARCEGVNRDGWVGVCWCVRMLRAESIGRAMDQKKVQNGYNTTLFPGGPPPQY